MINTIKIRTLVPKPKFSVLERIIFLGVIDLLIVGVILFFYIRVLEPVNNNIFSIKNIVELTYGLILFWSLGIIFNLYDLEFTNLTRKILPLIFFTSILFSLIYLFTPKITPPLPDKRIIILVFFLANITFLSLWRLFFIYFFHHRAFLKKIIILISEDNDKKMELLLNNFVNNKEKSFGYLIREVYKIPKNKDGIEEFNNIFNKVISTSKLDKILLLDPSQTLISNELNTILVKSIQKGIKVETCLKFYEETKEALPINMVEKQFYSVFPFSASNSNLFYKFWVRVLDIISAILGVSVVLVLIPFVGLVNLFINRGPLLYTQKRVGKGGIEYNIIKFRSMVVNAEQNGAKMSSKGDTRITGFGRILRKTRIDELPQFFNVFKGEMSLIGPRPERKVFVDQLADKIPFYNVRHLIKPGITGWAQVKYPYGEDLEDSYNKLEYDLYYIKNRSITLDVRIILKTINSVIFSKGQ